MSAEASQGSARGARAHAERERAAAGAHDARLQLEALALRRAVELLDAVDRELGDGGARGQAADLEPAADVADQRPARGLEQQLAAALPGELERVAVALALARDEHAHEAHHALLAGLARQQRGRDLEGEAVERGAGVDPQAQAG